MTAEPRRAPEGATAAEWLGTQKALADLKADHGRLEGKIIGLEGKIDGIGEKIEGLNTGIRGEIKGLNTGVSVVKWCLFGVMVPLAITILGGFVTVALRLFGVI